MLTKETVEKVAQLARLRLSEAELSAIQNQLSAVLENFEQIAQVDTANVSPLVTPTDVKQTLRADVAETYSSEKILESAPEKSGNLFKVPPVV